MNPDFDLMVTKATDFFKGLEMTVNPIKIEPRDDWELAQEIAAQEEIARMSNPEIEPAEKESDPFDVFNDYFDDVVEIRE